MSVEYPLFARKYVGALPDTHDADEVGKSFGLWAGFSRTSRDVTMRLE